MVVGNGAYRVAPLRNAVNDARLMGATLKELGFQVTLLENAALSSMLGALRSWLDAAENVESRVFYFAGHGVQSQGRNFLLPVDAAIASESELRSRAVDASELVDRMSRFERGVSIVVLDACRNLPESLASLGPRSRSLFGQSPDGLAPGEAPRGTLVAYSTAPGSVAADVGGGANSPYTRHLAEQLRVPGLPVESVFKRVRAAVMQETQRAQMPWETSSLVGDYCLRVDAQGRCAPPVRPSPQRQSVDLRRLQ
ncbi:MAG: caspase family protein [Gemmatimonadaceae bacterium]|jgi:carboxyl-terminal processing protease|nr:caspase family protein [Gemmatimonadaceae bacterium]